jgi:murein L,D-transpeptidase YcbB/YkuD
MSGVRYQGTGFAADLEVTRKAYPAALVLALVTSTASWQCSRKAAGPTPPNTSAALQAAVAPEKPPFAGEGGERGHHLWQEEQRFYKQNGYQLVWISGTRPRAQIDALIRALRAAGEDGLDPADYHADELDALRHAPFPRDDHPKAIDLDLRATYAYLRYASDMMHGTVDPEDVDPRWHVAPTDVDLHNRLEMALGQNQVAQSLQDLAPKAQQYQGLKHQLAQHRQQGDAAAVEQIAMNMERWRWLPDDLGSRHVMVNIPAFRLDVIEGGKSVLAMNVVIGKKASPTPVLSDRMKYVVFSPYWNIPSDIAEREIVPKAEKDPGYLERNNIEVDEEGGRYRQRPGKGNSLGLVKFVFPNHFNVYLHDTPAQSLFDRIERDFSHGCVRLERPMDLAKYVLRDQPEWTEEKISAAMQGGVERTVSLKETLPIYLVYFTAWEEDGVLKTVPDVYGHDRRHDAAAARR